MTKKDLNDFMTASQKFRSTELRQLASFLVEMYLDIERRDEEGYRQYQNILEKMAILHEFIAMVAVNHNPLFRDADVD